MDSSEAQEPLGSNNNLCLIANAHKKTGASGHGANAVHNGSPSIATLGIAPSESDWDTEPTSHLNQMFSSNNPEQQNNAHGNIAIRIALQAILPRSQGEANRNWPLRDGVQVRRPMWFRSNHLRNCPYHIQHAPKP